MEQPTDRRMTFGEHLEELRRRLLWAFAGVFAVFVASFAAQDSLMGIVARPYYAAMAGIHRLAPGEDLPEDLKFAPTEFSESFMTFFKLCLIASLFVSFPWVFYQLWKFVSAGLYPRERRWVRVFGPASAALFAGGAAFGYFVLLPFAIEFFATYGIAWVHPKFRISSYLDLFLALTVLPGVSFEMPLAMLFAARVGLVGPATFARSRRFAVVGILILAAVVTPDPSPVTMSILAAPLLGLYEAGVWLSRWGARGRESAP
jgi:sec-independent protein translocase protein TatC